MSGGGKAMLDGILPRIGPRFPRCLAASFVLLLAIILIVLIVAMPSSGARAQSTAGLQSPAFAPGQPIPAAYTCTGADKSPPLTWDRLPPATKTIALIVDDPDAPAGNWNHWALFNLPAKEKGLAEGIAQGNPLPNGASQGINSFGKPGYNGPCPPAGSAHHYHFRLLALDSSLDLPPTATAAELEQATRGHVVASAELVGTFGR
jgi:Raf kinase inhibitor-like YbhB/YbcL family protein